MALAIGTREAILAAKDIREDVLEIPEWGCAVKVRGFTLAQRHEVIESSRKNGEIDSLRLTIATFCAGVVEPHFDFVQDYQELRNKSAVVERVALRVNELSGIVGQAQTLKNSEATQSDK